MTIVLSIAGAAALIVIRPHPATGTGPRTGAAGLRAVRDLADVSSSASKPSKASSTSSARPAPITADTGSPGWGFRSSYDPDDDLEDDQQ